MARRQLPFLDLGTDERRPVLLLTIRALFASVIVVVAFSYQSSLFLSRFPANNLPWFYAVAAAVTVFFSIPYTRVIARFGEQQGDRLVCLVFLVGLVPGLFLDRLGNPPVVVFLYSTWVKMVGLFINIFLWHHATQTFISRRAKVILPVIAAGFSLGSALGGQIVRVLAITLGSQALLVLLMVLVVALLFVPIPPLQEVPRSRKGGGGSIWRRGFTTLRENRLALWLTVFVLLAIPVFLGMDFMFKKSLQERWTRDAIAAFMGKYYFYTNLTVFFLQTLIMGKLMRRVGVPRMTWFMPVFMLGAMPVLVFAPMFLPVAIIAIASATLKSTVYINARNQLIMPLSPLEKEATSMLLRTVVTPVGTILASFALIPVAGGGIPLIAGVTACICLAFVYSGHKAASAYMHELQTALRKKTLSPELSHNLAIAPDGRVVSHLRQRLLSSEPDEAIFAATLLSEYNELRLADLQALWHRPDQGHSFSLCAVKAVELARFVPAADQEAFFTRILENAFDARMAIRVLDAAPNLPAHLREILGKQTQLRATGPVQTATACILLDVSAQSLRKKEFSDLLDQLIAGGLHEKRLALRLAERLDVPARGVVLAACLSCGEPEVVRDAIGYVGSMQHEALYDTCYTLSFRPEYRRAALDAFRAAGVELAMSTRAFAGGCPAGLRKEWIRILCASNDPNAAERVRDLLLTPDAWTCSIVLDQLARPGSLELPKAFLEESARRIGRACAAAARALRLADNFTGMEIEAQKRFWTKALFSCLRLNEPDRAGELLEIEKSVFSRDARQQNAGLELWESWFQSRGKGAFATLLEPMELPHSDWGLEPVSHSLEGLLAACCDPGLTTQLTGRLHAPGAPAGADPLAPALFLRQSDFFRYLPTEVLLEMTRLGETIHLPAGEVLFEEKSPGDALYCVFSGRLRVRIQKTQVNELSQGAVFGEIALLDSGPRSASISCIEDSVLLKISRETFSEVLQEHPFVVKQVAMTLAARIRDLVVLVERRASGPVRALGEESS